VKSGVTFISVNYDLCPSVTLDEIVRQCGAAIAWTYANARVFGGDPNRISVCGHSAGAQIAVRMLETDWSQFGRVPDDVVKGVAAISGIYDLEAIRLSSTNNDVRLDVERSLRNSPMTRPLRRRVPLVLSVGDKDNAEFQRQTKDFASSLAQKSYLFELIIAKDRNHFSILDAMVDMEDPISNAIVHVALSAGSP
jgi:arylformamidase